MDASILWIIGLVVLILLVSGFAAYEVFAFDYISPYGSLWIKQPTICLDRNTNPELTWYAFRAMDSWQNVMEDYGYTNFNYTMYGVYDIDNSYHCDIMVRFGDPQRLGSSSTAIGVAKCNQDKPMMIGCEIIVKPYHKYWYGTMVHEVGHSFGIGHRTPYNNTGFAGVVLSADAMFKQVGFMRVITIHNVDFLIDHYGEDGWGMPNYMPRNYTIPHTVEEMEETHGTWTFEKR